MKATGHGCSSVISVTSKHLLFAGIACLLLLCPLSGSSHAVREPDRSTPQGGAGSGVQTTVTGGDLYALVVGVSVYQHGKIPKLGLASKDARDIADFLKTQEQLFNKVHLRLLVNKDATKRAIEKFLLYDLLTAGKDDSVLLFFSGHGAIDPKRQGEFFFLPYDADIDYLGATSVLMSGLRFMNKLRAARVVLIADACHSGGYSAYRTKSISRAMNKFIREFQESSGRLIISASQPDEYALEISDLDNGVFTHFMLEGFKGKADRDQDGIVTVKEAYEYVYKKTKDATQGAQHPRLEGHITGPFPISFLHPRGPILEITTNPGECSIYIRRGSGFNYVTKSDRAGHVRLNDLPTGTPLVIMARKPGWKDKILDPIIFSGKGRELQKVSASLDKAYAFLVLRTTSPGATVKLDNRDGGAFGDDGILIIEKVQTSVPHTIHLSKKGAQAKTLSVTIPEAFAGRVYRGPYISFDMKNETRIGAAQPNTPPDSENPVAQDDILDSSDQTAASGETPPPTDGSAHVKEKPLTDRLFQAVLSGRADELTDLLEQGADPNAKDSRDWTPLMNAVATGKTDIVRILLAAKADPDSADKLGRTPLIIAAANGYASIVKLLLQKGADKQAKDNYGITAGMTALAGKHTEVLSVLGMKPPAKAPKKRPSRRHKQSSSSAETYPAPGSQDAIDLDELKGEPYVPSIPSFNINGLAPDQRYWD
jgi:hypothetical protein